MGVPGPLNRGDWRKPEFRQNVRQKIEEVLRQSPNATYRNAGKLEAYSYSSATNKDQYLASVAQLIVQFKETEPRRAPPRSLHHVRPIMALRTMINRANGLPPIQRRSTSFASSSSGSSSHPMMMVTYYSPVNGRVVVPRAASTQPDAEQAGVAQPQE